MVMVMSFDGFRMSVNWLMKPNSFLTKTKIQARDTVVSMSIFFIITGPRKALSEQSGCGRIIYLSPAPRRVVLEKNCQKR